MWLYQLRHCHIGEHEEKGHPPRISTVGKVGVDYRPCIDRRTPYRPRLFAEVREVPSIRQSAKESVAPYYFGGRVVTRLNTGNQAAKE